MSSLSGASLLADFHLTCAEDATDGSRSRLLPRTFPDEPIPRIQPGLKVPNIFGNGAFIKLAHDGGDVNNVFQWCAEQTRQFPGDASYLLDLALLHLIEKRDEQAYRVRLALWRCSNSSGWWAPREKRSLSGDACLPWLPRAIS